MSDDSIFEEDYESEFASGPYCDHWNSPCDCEEKCKCGHECSKHSYGVCQEGDCPCEKYEDSE